MERFNILKNALQPFKTNIFIVYMSFTTHNGFLFEKVLFGRDSFSLITQRENIFAPQSTANIIFSRETNLQTTSLKLSKEKIQKTETFFIRKKQNSALQHDLVSFQLIKFKMHSFRSSHFDYLSIIHTIIQVLRLARINAEEHIGFMIRSQEKNFPRAAS